MCFVWISEQTAIISLYSINRLIFITGTDCVYCAVRTGPWNIIQVRFNFKFETRLHSQASPCKSCGKQSDTRTSFSPSTSVSAVSIIPPMLHTHLHLHVAFTGRTKGEIWKPSKSSSLSETRKNGIENYSHLQDLKGQPSGRGGGGVGGAEKREQHSREDFKSLKIYEVEEIMWDARVLTCNIHGRDQKYLHSCDCET
jgi:hypothetical protein